MDISENERLIGLVRSKSIMDRMANNRKEELGTHVEKWFFFKVVW